MSKLTSVPIAKITISFLLLLSAINCSKDQNSFLPYVKIDLQISLVNYNHLTIPGNSILFENYGYKGVIVVCVNPDLNLYYAYDACCPYETDYSGTVMIQQIKNLTPAPNTIYSSDFFGVCDKCGSKFNLMGSGQPTSGPATRYLQRYSISTGFESIMVSN